MSEQKDLSVILDEWEALASAATKGPWNYEQGGGHAHNRIVGAESVQTNGWPNRINGISNASYTDRVCENLGDDQLPYPAANIKFVTSARTSNPLLIKALRRAMSELKHCRTVEHLPTKAEADITAILNGEEKK